jgi:hypothetical protein
MTGRPLSQEEYEWGASELWEGDLWGGRSRDEINAERLERRDPAGDLTRWPAGWRRHELLNAGIRRHLGRSIPILGTSGGCAVGEVTDRRYPAVSPKGHSARHLEMARIMMGTSERCAPAPGYLFCAAFSLLGNYALGNFEPRWEPLAWVSPRWPNGQLPVVDALREEPKRQRWGEAESAHVESPLTALGIFSISKGTRSRPDKDFVEPDVGRPLSALLSSPGPAEEVVGLPGYLPETKPAPASASLLGRLPGGAGLTARLQRLDDGSVASQTIAADGIFVFREMRPGRYRLVVDGTSLCIEELPLEAGAERRLSLSMPPWSWRITRKEPNPMGFAIVRCSVEGRAELPVRIAGADWEGFTRHTGSRRDLGPFCCEFAPLASGRYVLEPVGLGLRVELEVEESTITYVEIIPTQVSAGLTEVASGAPAPKALTRYVLLARPFANKNDLLAVLRFASAHQAVCGFSVDEALWAKDIIIVGGGTLRVTEKDELRLRQSGARILRVEEQIADTLIRLSAVGDPFIEQPAKL